MVDKKGPEKFEQIIQAEIGDAQLDGLLDSVDISGEVREMVGERPSENAAGKSSKVTKNKKAKRGIMEIIFGSGATTATTTSKKLPAPATQKQVLRKTLVVRTRSLISEATKMQSSKDFSADKLERTLLEIRHLKQLLSEMFYFTAERIENMYRKYVLKEG